MYFYVNQVLKSVESLSIEKAAECEEAQALAE